MTSTAEHLAALDAYMAQAQAVGMWQAIGALDSIRDHPRQMGATATIPKDHISTVCAAARSRLVAQVGAVSIRGDAPELPELARRLRAWAAMLDEVAKAK